MDDYDIDDIANYEVGYIKNGQDSIICVTNDLEEATIIYEQTVAKYTSDNTIYHVIVYLYDNDKRCNINYYNNYDEI